MKKKKLLLVTAIILSLVLVLIGCGEKESEDLAPTADCTNGNFVGQVEEDSNVMSFKGIPYAKPPTGDLRWKPAEAPEESDETFDAKEFGKTSIQYE